MVKNAAMEGYHIQQRHELVFSDLNHFVGVLMRKNAISQFSFVVTLQTLPFIIMYYEKDWIIM